MTIFNHYKVAHGHDFGMPNVTSYPPLPTVTGITGLIMRIRLVENSTQSPPFHSFLPARRTAYNHPPTYVRLTAISIALFAAEGHTPSRSPVRREQFLTQRTSHDHRSRSMVPKDAARDLFVSWWDFHCSSTATFGPLSADRTVHIHRRKWSPLQMSSL